MSDRIEKSIVLNAPVSRVWRALTDHREFGSWFRVQLDAPFAEGDVSHGHITYPGYEHVEWWALVVAIRPETYFAFRWYPYAVDTTADYTDEPPTLVEFTLAPTAGGTMLTIVESGFDQLPAHRRLEAFRMNSGGWQAQTENIARHVS